MKHCVSCGAQLDDCAAYCGLCGTKQEVAFAPSPPAYQTKSEPNYIPPQPSASQPVSNNFYARSILYKHGSSRLFQAAVTIFIGLFLTSIVSFYKILSEFPFYAAYLDTFDSNLTLEELALMRATLQILQPVYYIIYILVLVPLLLFCIGMWMFMNSCKTQNGNTKGLSIIRGTSIGVLVTVLIFAVLIVLLVLAANILAFSTESVVVTAVFLIVVLPFIVFTCMFYLSIIKTLTKLRATVLNGAPALISRVIPIWLIVLLSFQGIGALLSKDMYTFIFSFFTIAYGVMFVKTIFDYNREISTLMLNSKTTPNSQQR